MARNSPDEDLPAGGAGHPAHADARAELRDRETYYAELRFAVHCQNRTAPAPRPVPGDTVPGDTIPGDTIPGDTAESWDGMIARFGDTWT